MGVAGVDRVSTPAVLRSAEVIAVGSELLGAARLDTNSLFISERLAALGIVLQAKAVVGDDREAIAEHLTRALARADLVVLTGGLGPTDDDLTRDAVAQVTGRRLVEDVAIVERIAARFARRGMRMPEVNRRQAFVLDGASVLENLHGTAPGQLVEHEGRTIVLLPGPPRELRPMLTALCDGPLALRAGAERIYRASLFVTGRTESHVEEAVQPIYSVWRHERPPVETTILASPGQIELHLALRSADADAARLRLEAASAQLSAALGRDVFSTDGRGMEEVVGALLQERGMTFAAAESCTGGLLTARLTDVPGSSAYVLGGVVSYSNDVKTAVLRVPEEQLRAHGAVSEPVAVALAEGVRALTGARLTVAITGVAGPGGGTPAKPVGTVVIAVVDGSSGATVRTFQLAGGRGQVRFQATQSALDMVRRLLVYSG